MNNNNNITQSKKKLNILTLLTDRKSNNVQILSIAKALIKHIDCNIYKRSVFFNILSVLPNFLLLFVPVWLTIKKNDGFNEVEDCDIIITCGRRSYNYAKHLKHSFFNTAKIIQILKPEHLFTKDIDVMLLPEHDKCFFKHKHLIRYRGSLCDKISDEKLTIEMNKFPQIKEMFANQKLIFVTIGGSSKHFHFSESLAEEFTRRINLISKNMNMPLLISTSRRTSEKIVNIIKDNLDCSYYFYNYNQSINDNKNNLNPYEAFIGYSEFNIATGDSISMMSELLASEKPLYIFTEGIKSKKYHTFHNYLIKNQSAKELRRDVEKLESFKPIAINNLDEISELILKKLHLV